MNILRRLALQEKKNLMTARVSMFLKSHTSLTCFRDFFLSGRAKDLSAPRFTTVSAAAGCFRDSIQSSISVEGHDINIIEVPNVKIKDFNMLTH